MNPSGLIDRLLARRNIQITAIAFANKNARIAWALLSKGEDYRAGYHRCEPADSAHAVHNAPKSLWRIARQTLELPRESSGTFGTEITGTPIEGKKPGTIAAKSNHPAHE